MASDTVLLHFLKAVRKAQYERLLHKIKTYGISSCSWKRLTSQKKK